MIIKHYGFDNYFGMFDFDWKLIIIIGNSASSESISSVRKFLNVICLIYKNKGKV